MDDVMRVLDRRQGEQGDRPDRPGPEESSIVELLLLASTKGHRQLCACTILKTVQIINHMAGRELLFRLPVSDRDLFHLVEEKVYRVVGTMLGEGFPISEFVGGRKNLDSTYTKLLSKPEATAAALYDKLRFRIVTKTGADILPVVLYLSDRLFPFNFVVPKQSTNTIFHFRSYCEKIPHLAGMVPEFQGTIKVVEVGELPMEPAIFDLEIREKKFTSTLSTLHVYQGDSVEINVLSDGQEELYLHGYDKSAALEAGKTSTLIFAADVSGKFTFELLGSGVEIGSLIVEPK